MAVTALGSGNTVVGKATMVPGILEFTVSWTKKTFKKQFLKPICVQLFPR